MEKYRKQMEIIFIAFTRNDNNNNIFITLQYYRALVTLSRLFYGFGANKTLTCKQKQKYKRCLKSQPYV